MKKFIYVTALFIFLLGNISYGLTSSSSREIDFSPYFKTNSELNNKLKSSLGFYWEASSVSPFLNASYEHDFNESLSLELGVNYTIIQALMSMMGGSGGIFLAFVTGSFISVDYAFSDNYKKFRPYIGTHLNVFFPGIHTGFDTYLNDNKYINVNLAINRNILNTFTKQKVMPVLSVSYGIKF